MTTFHNEALPTADLPSLKALDTQPMAKHYLSAQLMATAVFFGALCLVLSLVRFQPFIALPAPVLDMYPVILTVAAVIGTVIMGYQLLATPKKRFALREQDLHYHCGLLFRKLISQPILRIQHIEIKRGPFDRVFGIAALHVYSAGGAAHTFIIPGLEFDQAARIRQYILDHKDSQLHG